MLILYYFQNHSPKTWEIDSRLTDKYLQGIDCNWIMLNTIRLNNGQVMIINGKCEAKRGQLDPVRR